MGLTDFKKFGKWNDPKNRHGYDKQSVGILNSDAGVNKIKDKFNKIDLADFNLYFVKKPNVRKYQQLGKVSDKQVFDYTGLKVGEDIPNPDQDAITIIFTNNDAAEKTPLTYWTIAHRISHAFYVTDGGSNDNRIIMRRIYKILQEIFEYCYNFNMSIDDISGLNKPIIRHFFESIGTFRSARMKKIVRGFEFIHECFAQYLLSNGNLNFNDFPEYLKVSNKQEWGRYNGRTLKLKDELYAQDLSYQLRDVLIEYFDYLIGTHVNSISIM